MKLVPGVDIQVGVRARRSDAMKHREALIQAATECFEEQGYLVPLEQIATRAGVGRGTLYRNFADRMALALAVFERKGAEAEASLHPSLPLEEALRTLIQRGARSSALFNRLAAEMPLDDESIAALQRIGERTAFRIEPLVERARAAGMLRPDIDSSRIILAARMVSGLLLPHMTEAQIQQQIADAMPIVMSGLRGT